MFIRGLIFIYVIIVNGKNGIVIFYKNMRIMV